MSMAPYLEQTETTKPSAADNTHQPKSLGQLVMLTVLGMGNTILYRLSEMVMEDHGAASKHLRSFTGSAS